MDNNGRIHCSQMITKARVASLKVMAIPRMQLVAATPSILVKNELEIPVNNNVFRTDTEVALNQKSSGYSWKTNLKLSRIIQMNSSGIMSVQNRTKVDYASKWIVVCNDEEIKRWFLRLQFLWEPDPGWNENRIIPLVNEKDRELKKIIFVFLATKPVDVLTALENRISDCSRMVRVVALVIKFMEILLSKINHHKESKKCNCT